MDSLFWPSLTLAATLAFATWRERRTGRERRDTALLGAVTLMFAAGALLAAID